MIILWLYFSFFTQDYFFTKLRSTFGTSLYNETGDIYLVATVLGHKDVNTTKKHYAALNQNRLRIAANSVKLREK